MSAAHRPWRVVLDTNVVLSALVFGGQVPGQVRQAWQTGALVPLVCRATVQELIRVLAYPRFRLNADEQEELLADFLPWAEVVDLPDPPPAVPACRDRADEVFMQLAVASRADALVSGDQDLLALAPEMQAAGACPVLTAEAWLRHRAKKAAAPGADQR